MKSNRFLRNHLHGDGRFQVLEAMWRISQKAAGGQRPRRKRVPDFFLANLFWYPVQLPSLILVLVKSRLQVGSIVPLLSYPSVSRSLWILCDDHYPDGPSVGTEYLTVGVIKVSHSISPLFVGVIKSASLPRCINDHLLPGEKPSSTSETGLVIPRLDRMDRTSFALTINTPIAACLL
jgi:hypothetical protein